MRPIEVTLVSNTTISAFASSKKISISATGVDDEENENNDCAVFGIDRFVLGGDGATNLIK